MEQQFLNLETFCYSKKHKPFIPEDFRLSNFNNQAREQVILLYKNHNFLRVQKL